MKTITFKNCITIGLFAIFVLLSQFANADPCVVKTTSDLRENSDGSYPSGYGNSIDSQFKTLSITDAASCAAPTSFYDTENSTLPAVPYNGYIPMYGADTWPTKWILFYTTNYSGGDYHVDEIEFEEPFTIDLAAFTLIGNPSPYIGKYVDDTNTLVDYNNSERDAEYSADAEGVVGNLDEYGSITLDFRTNFETLDFNTDTTNTDVDTEGHPEATTDSDEIDWSKFPIQCSSGSEKVALWNTVILLPDSFYGKNRNNSAELKKIIFDPSRAETACLVDFGANYVCVGTRKTNSDGSNVDPSTQTGGDLEAQNDSWCEATPDISNGFTFPGIDLTPGNFLQNIWWPDLDGDTYGVVGTGEYYAPGTEPTGYVKLTGDCDDNQAAAYPGNTEICDEIDNDCNGIVDDMADGSICDDGTIYYEDNDGDGSGGDVSTAPTTVTTGGDCDDSDATAFPGNPEVCDGVDNDCDGTIDNLSTGTCTVYEDTDGDGYGDEVSTDGSGVTTGGDCDDTNPAVNPGAIEICGNTVDEDCSGADETCTIYYDDVDGDGYGDDNTEHTTEDSDDVTVGGDCDDRNLNIHPGALEVCESVGVGNGTDENCDGVIDEGCSIEICGDGLDNDGNGLQDDQEDISVCDYSDADDDHYTVVDGDCNDNDATIHPNADSVCNGIDMDCDGAVNDDNICINGVDTAGSLFGDEGFIQLDGGAFGSCSLQDNGVNQNASSFWQVVMIGFGALFVSLRKRAVQ